MQDLIRQVSVMRVFGMQPRAIRAFRRGNAERKFAVRFVRQNGHGCILRLYARHGNPQVKLSAAQNSTAITI